MDELTEVEWGRPTLLPTLVDSPAEDTCSEAGEFIDHPAESMLPVVGRVAVETDAIESLRAERNPNPSMEDPPDHPSNEPPTEFLRYGA